jgi:hypothetical protein
MIRFNPLRAMAAGIAYFRSVEILNIDLKQ